MVDKLGQRNVTKQRNKTSRLERGQVGINQQRIGKNMTEEKQEYSTNGLSVKQNKAITALLSERTAKAAAHTAGVGERTLFTWLADKDFRAALKSAESDALEMVTRRLSAGQALALDTLETLITKAKHESTKLTACVSWLNMFIKYRDMKDIDERLTRLEEAMNDKK